MTQKTFYQFTLSHNSPDSVKVMATAEPWVGTWRPHKPRGSIAAFYSSPGPKYALPGLTGIDKIVIKLLLFFFYYLLLFFILICFHKGISKHDPTKYKAPMFSFGIRHDQSCSDCSPGPRYLIPSNITREGRDGTPAFSLHSRPRDPKLFRAPGPG